MSTQTGYYALLQLSPQPDSEEAVNVGVYLLCPQAGWAELASLPELPGRARAMFPDLPEWLYALALEQQAAQLAQMKQHALHQPPSDWLAQAHAYLAPEEGILRLGTLRHVCVADHPEQALFKLFVQYVPQPSTVEERQHLTPMKSVPLQYVSNRHVNLGALEALGHENDVDYSYRLSIWASNTYEMTRMMTYVNEIDLFSRAIESMKDSMVNQKISTDFSSIFPMHAHTVKLSVLAQPAQRGQAEPEEAG